MADGYKHPYTNDETAMLEIAHNAQLVCAMNGKKMDGDLIFNDDTLQIIWSPLSNHVSISRIHKLHDTELVFNRFDTSTICFIVDDWIEHLSLLYNQASGNITKND